MTAPDTHTVRDRVAAWSPSRFGGATSRATARRAVRVRRATPYTLPAQLIAF